MKATMRIALVLGAAVGLSACASVTRGTKQTFFIQSEPAGGEVTTSTGQKCVTPCKLKLARKDGFEASIALQGYKPGTARVDSKTSSGGMAGTLGNALIGGMVGMLVDSGNGSTRDLEPNPLKWALAAEGSADETKLVPGVKPKTTPRKAPVRSSSRKRTATAAPVEAAPSS